MWELFASCGHGGVSTVLRVEWRGVMKRLRVFLEILSWQLSLC